jgi:hypothetical protein
MPKETPGTELNEYQKDQDEFNAAVQDIFSADTEVTDEEINKKLDEELGKRPDDTASGDATGDPVEKQVVADDASKAASTDTAAEDKTVDQSKVATDTDTTDWKAKAETTEAELAKEKQKTSSWNGRITAANDKVKVLEDKITELETATPSEEDLSDQTKIDKFRKDFPELGDVVDIMEKRIDKVAAPTKAAAAPAEEVFDQVDTNKPDDGPTSHYTATRDVHPELDEIVNSGVLLTWVRKQPDYIRPHLEKVYFTGDSEQVISMVTEFKNSSNWKSQLESREKDLTKEEKLQSLVDVNSDSSGPKGGAPDKNDFAAGAKDAGL